MATTQYIGARYVPKFYENGGGTSEWTANTAYEPLTIVTRNGNSYTSKKLVPASVGAPENNADYWVSTGIYNQQVEQYRQEVEAISADYERISGAAEIGAETSFLFNKRIVVYGDSISNSPTPATSYWGILSDRGLNITNRAVSGSSLEGNINALRDATDLATFDVIFLAFGTNEWQGNRDYERVRDNMVMAIEIIKQHAPKINIIFITPPFGHNNEFDSGIVNVNNRGYRLEDVANWINTIAQKYGCPVIDFYHESGANELNYTQLMDISTGFGDIYVHPNAAFAAILADLVLNATFNTHERTEHVNDKNYFVLNMFLDKIATTDSDINAMPQGCRGGLKIKVPANGMSLNVTPYLPPVKMRLCGFASADMTFTFTVSNVPHTLKIAAGEFNTLIDFKEWFTNVTSVAISIAPDSTNAEYIGRLGLYEVESNYCSQDRYDHGIPIDARTNVTIQGDAEARLRATDEKLSIGSFSFGLSAEISSGSNLFSGNFSAPSTGIFCTAIKTTGEVYVLYISGSYIKNAQTMPAGNYRFMPLSTVI